MKSHNGRGGRLSRDERRKLITGRLERYPAIRVSVLASDIGVSTETIRRDLEVLEKDGLISRAYGFAARPLAPEPEFMARDRLFSEPRNRIARAMSALVEDGQVLIIGSSTTTLRVAERLASDHKDLCIYTDSTLIASKLSSNPTFRIRLVPGIYKDSERYVYGPDTVDYIRRIYANHAILGATGLSSEGISNADHDVGETYRAMSMRAEQVSVVADHSKFMRPAVNTYAQWGVVDRLITDLPPYCDELLQGLKAARVEVVVAGEDGEDERIPA